MYDTEENKIKEARPEKSCWTSVKQSKTKKAWPSKFDHDEVKPAVCQEEPLPYACADLITPGGIHCLTFITIF